MKRVWLNTRVNVWLAAGLCIVLLAACGGDSPATLVKSAKDYLAKGDSSAALIQLRNALQKAPDDPEARYLLGTALTERRDSAGAVKELRMALQLGYPADVALPALARALVADGDATELVTEFGDTTLGSSDAQAAFKTTIGNALLSLGKLKEAEAAFNAALTAKADYADALLGIAILRAGSGDIEGSRKIVDAVLAQPHAPPEASLLKARLLVAEGQTDSATVLLMKALEAKPDYLQARYLLASLLIGKGDLEQATAQVGAIRKISKLDRQAYYFEALIASRRGDLPAAREAIQQVLKGGFEYLPGLLLAGEIEFRAKQYNQALDYLRRAVNRAPASTYAQRLLAATYLRLGSPAHALEVLQPALSRGTPDPQLMTVAGEAYLAVGDIPKAAQYFAQTTALDPKNAAARTRLGQVRFAEGDNEGAIRDLEAASAMDPNVSPADLALITNLLRQKQFDQALAAVGRLEKKQPNNPLVYNLRGIVYLTKHDVGAARENFERALQIQPDYLPAIGNLAQLDWLEKKPDLARKRYDAVLEKDPKNEQALLALTNLLQSLGGDPTEIESLLKKAVTANPQSINARVALVAFYARRGDGKQALLAAQEANAALPNDPRTLELLGQVQQVTGDATLAVGTFSKLVAAQPGALGPLLRLAGALVAVKDYDTVRGAWGEKDSLDIMAGVDVLLQKGYIDEQRMGVTGGSYGGFMTNWLIGHYDRFKVAVTDRCVTNMVSDFGSSDFGWVIADDEFETTPWEDPERYRRLSPITYVKNMHTPLLIIHSEQDLRCNIEQAEQLFASLKYMGREVLFVRFEGQSHGLSRGGHPKLRLERLRHILGWFEKYLK